MNKYDGGITFVVIGITLILVYLLVPKSLPKNWFIDSGVDGRRRSKVFGIALIAVGILIMIFG